MTEFEILEQQAKELFRAFPELEFKTVAALTIVIGWLLTAGQAKIFVVENPLTAIFGSIAFFGLFAFAQLIYLVGHYRKLRSVILRLDILAREAGYSNVIVDTYRIGKIIPVSYAIVNVLLCLAIIVLVYLISGNVFNLSFLVR